MATYIMLMKFIDPGLDSLQNAQKGRAAGKKAAKALGVTWKGQYLTMGEFDVVQIIEAPDDETAARFSLVGMGAGSLSITTMRAFTESEADKLLKDLPTPEGADG